MSTENFFDKLLDDGADVRDDQFVTECMQRFDRDEDGMLNLKELRCLTDELFVDETGTSYEFPVRMCAEMLYAFDTDHDGKLNMDELKELWFKVIVPVVKPVSALVVIDVQNDFIDGSLAIRNCPAGQEGFEVVPVINDLLDAIPFNYVFYTYDWHPDDHVSFIDNVHLRNFHETSLVPQDEAKIFDTVVFEGPPPIEQKLWPRHCVQNSWGSELHSELKIADNATFIYKGTCSDIDSYSAFWDNQKLSQTNLSEEMKSRGVTDIFVTGLATEYCVGYTALHALEHGYRTILIEDACRGVDLKDIEATKEKLQERHGVIVSSDKVKNMVLGRDRRRDLGYRTAMLAVKGNN
ncbi:nicotinamidase-like [Argiope bruennichi]|uniref:nicotinamidase-like n=1 Tax=Argiope bruennichi TaxID=94029 RepID=UPI0024947D47|nr:nicotinamidase-like [Argiope bruennichi]